MPQGPTRADEFDFDGALSTLDEELADYPAPGPPDGDQRLAPADPSEWGFGGEDPAERSYEDDPAQDYWAREEDEYSLVSELESKVEEFRNYQRSSAYWRWLIKNWQYAHNLYYDDQIDSIGVSALGDVGELVGYAANHFRNLLQHLLTLTTRDRPALVVRAKNSDARSIIQAKLGKNIVESYFRDKAGEKYLKRAVEDALVFAQGYMEVTWDPNIGEEVEVDPETGDATFEGDLQFWNPTAWDVFYDLGVLDWDKQNWVIVRHHENKWDLTVRHPQHRDAIQSALAYSDNEEDTNRPLQLENEIYQETDAIEVFYFYHKRTDALPEGRFCKYVAGALLVDTPLPYRGLPVYRVTAGELLLSPFGYTPAFDLQAPQEVLNQEISTVITNHTTFGVQNCWTRTGDNIGTSELPGGMIHVQSDEPPQPLQLTETPAEVFKFIDMTIQTMEYLSGVNSVARGQPEASLKSGAALALIDAKAVQFASSLIHSYHQLIENVGTGMIEILRDFAQTDRVLSIIGKWNRTYAQAFTGEDLEQVDRVMVESTNPVLNTFAGRIELADKLLRSQLLTTPEEYINVVQTGQVESMLEAENAQLAKVRDENEALLDGRPVVASPYDNHVLHIKECHSLINSVQASEDPDLVSGVAAHIMEHVFLLEDAEIQKVLQVLGYQIPLPPTHISGTPMPAPMAPGGPPPPEGMGPATIPDGIGPDLAIPPNGMEPGLDNRSAAKLPRMPTMPMGAM